MKTRQIAEITAAAATGLLHPLFVDVFHAKALFIALAAIGWSAYFVLRVRRDRSVLREWGFCRENLRPASLAALAVLLAGVLVISLLPAGHGAIRFNRHMIPLFLLYPAWGLLQQFLVQALFVRNLQDAGAPILVIVLAAATLFGLVHLPDWKLAIATAALGAALTPIYLRWRNLWPLGICHGWLGVFAYFWIFHRDPWVEVFGSAF
ncbi:MAG TPA: CPBP family glutamic-type intramembrane protease [Thermoanaerobaculia bacterium]|nr:CPBP family glutamic-type intramembrane protease [Thermoanaerobaculia bacterium]